MSENAENRHAENAHTENTHIENTRERHTARVTREESPMGKPPDACREKGAGRKRRMGVPRSLFPRHQGNAPRRRRGDRGLGSRPAQKVRAGISMHEKDPDGA